MSTVKSVVVSLIAAGSLVGLTGCDTGLGDARTSTGGAAPNIGGGPIAPNRCGGAGWSGEPGQGKVILSREAAKSYLHDYAKSEHTGSDGMGDHQAAIDEYVNGVC